jgi:hypothetical protein
MLVPELPPPPKLQELLRGFVNAEDMFERNKTGPGVKAVGEYHYEFGAGGSLQVMTPEQLAKRAKPWVVALLEGEVAS